MPSGCNVCNSRIQKLSLLCLCHDRLNGHRSDITKKSFLPVSQHFGLSDHSLEDFKRMKILVIEQNCLWNDDDVQRENRERFWIKVLRVLHPDGISPRFLCRLTAFMDFL